MMRLQLTGARPERMQSPGHLRCVVVALLFLVSSVPAMGQDDRLLRVGLCQNEPRVHVRQDGSTGGLFVDLLDHIARQENWHIEYLSCNWPDCLRQLESGQLDLIPDIVPSESRRQHLDFNAIPVLRSWSQVYAGLHVDLPELSALEGMRLSVLRHSAQHRYLEGMRNNGAGHFDIVAVDSTSEVLAAVGLGLADAAVASNLFDSRIAARHGLAETPITFDHVSLHFATAAGHRPDVLAAIDRHLTRWKAEPDSPYYTAVLGALGSVERSAMPAWLMPVSLITGGLVLVLLGNIYLLRWRVRSQTARLLRSSHQLEHLMASSPVILYSLKGRDLCVDWVSGNVDRILGFSRTSVMQPDWWERQIHPEDRSTAVRQNTRIFREHHMTQEYRVHDGHGRIRHIRDERRLIPPATRGRDIAIIGSWTDLTDEYERQEQVRFLSHYDPRTRLPNRNLLIDRLDQAIRRAGRKQGGLMLVLVDLDRFKHINDTLGMSVGDEVLEHMAERLQALCGADDTVARAGSDEFCLIFERELSDSDARELADAVLRTIVKPVSTEGRELTITASLGAAGYPGDGQTRESLLAAAELAMEAAKRAGGDQYHFYEPDLGERTSRRLFLEHELRQAVVAEELELHFQPQLCLSDLSVSGMEALVRWNRPGLGMVPPGEFIPLAEETGLIGAIDAWVLARACAQMAEWDSQGQSVARISVNFSAREFYDDALVERVQATLAANNLVPERLQIEITETMLMEFPERALKALRRLDTLGVQLCMDDFGSGYSNLAFIQRLPLHQLKVDQSLVRDIEHSQRNRSIIQAIIAMAHALELELVAEGIENHRQLAFLREAGCKVGQGYLLGKPRPAGNIPDTPATTRLHGAADTP